MGRGYRDQIAILHIIVEQSVEWQSLVYICFVDFAKAFDSINRDVLSTLLCHNGVPVKITNLVRKFYDSFKAKIIHKGHTTESFEMLSSIKKGCLLSPLRFLVVLDWVTRSAQGIQWQLTKRQDDLEKANGLALLNHWAAR